MFLDPVDREVIAMDGGGRPPWSVLLLCGASGTGKTQVSYPLARHYGVPIVEVDDLVEALQAMTTPEQQPILHYWRTHPEAARLPRRTSPICRSPSPRRSFPRWTPSWETTWRPTPR